MDELAMTSSNDRHGDLFQPEVILPTQFFVTLRGAAAYQGERRLLLAVLEDAVSCFRKHLVARDARGRRLFREAQGWIMSEDREYAFSFENICDTLHLSAGYIRQGVRHWARAAASQAQPESPTDDTSGWRRRAAAPTAAAAIRTGSAAADASRGDRVSQTSTPTPQTRKAI